MDQAMFPLSEQTKESDLVPDVRRTTVILTLADLGAPLHHGLLPLPSGSRRMGVAGTFLESMRTSR